MNKSKFACLSAVALILAACSPAPAPEPEPAPVAAPPSASVSSSCANVTLTATASTPPAREVTIAAAVENAPADTTYMWSVSAGAITSGQGTASIIVDPPTGEPLTATLQISGLPEPCFGSATIEIP